MEDFIHISIVINAILFALLFITLMCVNWRGQIAVERISDLEGKLNYLQDDINTLIAHLGADRGVLLDSKLHYDDLEGAE